MLGSLLHLLFGNFGIGVLEGLILSLWFKRKWWLCIAIMIAANYFSAWIGYVFLGSKIASGLAVDIYSLRQFLAAMILATYLMTLALEWPFVAACFWKAEHWFRKSVVATLLVQTVSYALIFGWYWVTSSKSLLTNATAVAADQIPVADDLTLYYIADYGEVRSLHLRDGTSTVIGRLRNVGPYDRLLARYSSSRDGSWDLVANHVSKGPKYERSLVRGNLHSKVALCELDHEKAPVIGENLRSWYSLGGGQSDWECNVGDWPWWGLSGRNIKTGETWRIALEVPFLAWWVRDFVEVPGEKFIFQLGRDQICIFDARSHKIALLAKGFGPLVALDAATRVQGH